eukprot:scaffold51834_cov67-Attheya_sp.AAC.3
MMKAPSKHRKPGHGTRIADCTTRSAKRNTKTAPPDIKPQTPHAPYPSLPHLPPSANWTSKSKHIRKPSSIPITHHPSTTRNAKSKSKSMNDDLDEANASDLMIVDLPSASKPPSKTTKPKPKSVSAPQNDNDTDKETSPSPDTYHILAVHTQWLFRFKNVPPLSKNAKPSKHKFLADPPTTTPKVKSKDKKNLNNMATTDPVHEEEACKEKTATAPVNIDKSGGLTSPGA